MRANHEPALIPGGSRQQRRAALRARTWRDVLAGYAAGRYGSADRRTKRRVSAAIVNANWRSLNA